MLVSVARSRGMPQQPPPDPVTARVCVPRDGRGFRRVLQGFAFVWPSSPLWTKEQSDFGSHRSLTCLFF